MSRLPTRTPSERELRWFPLLLLCVFGLVGAVAMFRIGAPRTGLTLWGLGLVLSLLHALVPGLRRPLYAGWMRLVSPLGWAISHGVLAIIYFGIITPFALVFRLAGRDKLERRFDPRAQSYWTPRATGDDTARYLRQS